MSIDTKPAATLQSLPECFPGLKVKSCLYMSDSAFMAGTKAVYGKSISLIESSNDTTHEYLGVTGSEDTWDEDDLKSAIESGDIECYKASVVLNDLVQRGVLPAGDYFIRVCW